MLTSDWEISQRIAGYALDRLGYVEGVSAVGIGTTVVASIAALEGYWQLPTTSNVSFIARTRFVARYALYNVIPSLIWETHSPETVIKSSTFLSQSFGSECTTILSAKRSLWIRMCCALRGAVAGGLVLTNIVALTSTWQEARKDYGDRIRQGKEPPLNLLTGAEQGCTIRLAGIRSHVTDYCMDVTRESANLWPVFENADAVHGGLAGTQSTKSPTIPFFWQVNDGQYSLPSSWNGLIIPATWIYSKSNGDQLLYLEADATSGDESALAVKGGSDYYHHWYSRSELPLWNGHHSKKFFAKEAPIPYSQLDLDLKEIAQGFRRLGEIGRRAHPEVSVARVILVDPSIQIESGGGRRMTVRQQIEELGLADIVVDSRTSVRREILTWLENYFASTTLKNLKRNRKRRVILETPSKVWFHSLQSELANFGYQVVDRTAIDPDETVPVLVYERSSADTVHTIRQYLERGIIKSPQDACALLASHQGISEALSLGYSCVCSSAIHDGLLAWVKGEFLKGRSASDIQRDLDTGRKA